MTFHLGSSYNKGLINARIEYFTLENTFFESDFIGILQHRSLTPPLCNKRRGLTKTFVKDIHTQISRALILRTGECVADVDASAPESDIQKD